MCGPLVMAVSSRCRLADWPLLCWPARPSRARAAGTLRHARGTHVYFFHYSIEKENILVWFHSLAGLRSWRVALVSSLCCLWRYQANKSLISKYNIHCTLSVLDYPSRLLESN